MLKVTAALVVGLFIAANAHADIVFDDFNAGIGTHFNGPANQSGTTNILHTATIGNLNVTTRTTSGVFEGAGALQIGIVGGNQTASGFPRIRYLSGGGNTGNNVSFTTTAGEDGWIGFLYKVPAPGALPNSLPAGLQLQLNLDGASGLLADADSGVPVNAIMDDQWHLVEWDLDNPSQWVPTPGIGGDGILQDGESRTIDSIYFRYPTFAGWTGYTGAQSLFIDFVAKSDSGSIVPMIPEPTSLGILAIGAFSLLRRRF